MPLLMSFAESVIRKFSIENGRQILAAGMRCEMHGYRKSNCKKHHIYMVLGKLIGGFRARLCLRSINSFGGTLPA